jgi:hypothetical protein
MHSRAVSREARDELSRVVARIGELVETV